MLAYYVEFQLRQAWAPILFADHDPQARERASVVAPPAPSPAVVRKRTRRRTDNGLAVMAYHDLMAHLGTLALNEVALPAKAASTFKMLTRPTALQEKAFELLAVQLPRVQ